MTSGLGGLPTKLGAAVKEYLRQRESGALQGHWTICLQLAKLLRGAYLSGDEAVIKAIKGALIEMDSESEMLVRCMSYRLAKADSKTESFVEEVRLAPTELQAEVRGDDTSTKMIVMEGDHAILLEEDADANIQVMKRNEIADVTRILETSNVSRCIIVSTGIHCTKGMAVCPGGSRVFARAARRLGVPVIIAAGRFSFVHADEGEECDLPKRKRAHPGDSRRKNNGTDIVRYKTDHLPIDEVTLVMTEQGGYHPEYVKTLTSTD